MTQLTFKPLDTLFFSDGRPYNLDESNAQVVSQFPPFAPTLIGAVRAAYARALGWPAKDWDIHIKQKLGSGKDLGPVAFFGPYLLKDKKPVFPAPASLVKGVNGKLVRLSPGPERHCDLSESKKVRLPEPHAPASKYEAVSGWLTVEGMQKLLESELPDPQTVLDKDILFRYERRVGNWRVTATRTVSEDNAIYSPAHVRLPRDVKLALVATGLPEVEPDNPAPTAGESRMCWISREESKLDLPVAPKLEAANGMLHYCVILITPLDIEGIGLPKPNAAYAGLPGTLVSACIGKAQRVGGWGGWKGPALGGGEPLPLRTLLPAGGVFFMKTSAKTLDAVDCLHGVKIGACQEWGFGQILIGTWGGR